MRYRILNMADLTASPDALGPLERLGEVVSLPASREALLEAVAGFDAYFASLVVRADAEVLERAGRLRAIATPSTGLDHIDLTEAARRGIAILSLKDDTEFLSRVTATAELAWGLLLAVVRRLPGATAAARRGDWARDRFRGRQLSGKTLGVLGYGRLGRMVARYGLAFGMRVLACDVRAVQPEAGVEMTSFDSLLRESDVLSVHVHLTEANRGLVSAGAIAKMKPGAVLLNTSRGAIVDESALLAALESGRLAGAGLDVIHGEWDADLANHPLIRYAAGHENLVITPHVGGVTHESQAMTLEHTARKLAAYLEGLHEPR
jgi:D-3-phosphoglycerate dehydrogenase / 2-oxoglutarate reductase